MGRLIQRLKLVKQLALIADKSLLLVKLVSQLCELGIFLLLLCLQGRLKRAFLILFHLDHRFFRLYMHPQQFSLLIELLLLLAQFVQRLEQAFNAALTRLPQRADHGFCLADPLPQNTRLRRDPLDILDQIVQVFLVCLFFAREAILFSIVLVEDCLQVGDLSSDLVLRID